MDRQGRQQPPDHRHQDRALTRRRLHRVPRRKILISPVPGKIQDQVRDPRPGVYNTPRLFCSHEADTRPFARRWEDMVQAAMRRGMRSKAELIAYADRFGGDLAGLRALLSGPLQGLFGGVHVLPFYRPFDGADAGFDPQDHTEVDARLGSWDDVAALCAEYRVMADVIVNHVSSSSPQFQDWLAKGPASQFAGMFLTYGTAFPEGATEDILMRLYRPRPGLPFTPYVLSDGRKTLVWTTFTPQQIDVDVRHLATRAYLLRVLDKLAGAHVSHVRLDAVGYAVKTPGLTSFMTPETFKFIDEVTEWCRERDLEVLVEVHSYYLHQVEIARQVDYVYDFALPPLVLHALTAADASPLLTWLQHRPANAVTVLDTHDGIGVIDVGPDATDRARPGLLG